MESKRIDDIARRLGSRRGILGLLGVGLGGSALMGTGTSEAKKGHAKKRRRRKKQRKEKPKDQQRQYPVLTTCATATEELGPIPGGPYPTCQSQYDPDEFAPCNTSLTFADLQDLCNDAYPACDGECRLLSEPVVGLGDCPDFTTCKTVDDNGVPLEIGPIPGGPYGSCWSGPHAVCWSCPGATPNYAQMEDLCGQHYAQQRPNGCFVDQFNECYPA